MQVTNFHFPKLQKQTLKISYCLMGNIWWLKERKIIYNYVLMSHRPHRAYQWTGCGRQPYNVHVCLYISLKSAIMRLLAPTD